MSGGRRKPRHDRCCYTCRVRRAVYAFQTFHQPGLRRRGRVQVYMVPIVCEECMRQLFDHHEIVTSYAEAEARIRAVLAAGQQVPVHPRRSLALRNPRAAALAAQEAELARAEP